MVVSVCMVSTTKPGGMPDKDLKVFISLVESEYPKELNVIEKSVWMPEKDWNAYLKLVNR